MTIDGRSDHRDSAAAGLASFLDAPLEELDAELNEYMIDGPLGPAIKHPLVISPVYLPQLNSLYNEQIRTKRDAVAAALAGGDIAQVVWLHERPWRAEIFAALADRFDDRSYWQLLAHIWTDSENIVEKAALWDQLLRAPRTGCEAMMTEDELAALDALPASVEIFQGHTDRRDDGWSWTTDRTVAVWFAQRFAQLEGGRPQLSRARVPRSAVFAHLLGRGEAEILVPPERVEGRTNEPL